MNNQAFVNRNSHQLPEAGTEIEIKTDSGNVIGIWYPTKKEPPYKKGDSLGYVKPIESTRKYYAKHGMKEDFFYFRNVKEQELTIKI